MRLPRLTISFNRGKSQRHQNFLRREIGFMLLLKILFLSVLWLVFFSQPSTKTDVAARVAERIAGSGLAAAVETPRPTQDQEQP